MHTHSPCIFLAVVFGLVLVCTAPAAGQAASHTTLQVYTDEEVIGRVVSLTPAEDIGAYAVSITRGTSVQPAAVGDRLYHKDVITIQRGSFAEIQLVDRSDVTSLGGGSGGTAVLLERAGAISGATATASPPGPRTETIYIDREEEDPFDVGRITYVQGGGYIQRDARLIPATVGEQLMVGDTVSTEEGSRVTVRLNNQETKEVRDGGSLIIEEKRGATPQGLFEPVISLFGGIWETIRGTITTVEGLISTATAGVRG